MQLNVDISHGFLAEHHSDRRLEDDKKGERSMENAQRLTKIADIPVNCDRDGQETFHELENSLDIERSSQEDEDPYAELEMYLERVKVSNCQIINFMTCFLDGYYHHHVFDIL